MRPREHRAPTWRLLSVIAGIAPLVLGGCSGQEDAASLAASRDLASNTARVKKLPRLASAPEAPRLMQLYFNTSNGREWIYDGARWVPHDATVDSYYKELASKGPEGTLRAVQPGGAALTVPFSPTGAHTKHRAYLCTDCHLVGGSPCLDPAGAAAAPGQAAPSFDATAKTCSSVACHGAYSGTYTYARWDWGIEDFVYVDVPYAGGGGAANGWYTTGSSCTTCHHNPPANGTWHSPTHGMTVTAARKCETCHPDAVSAVVNGVYVGVSISATNAALHANGIVNVQARFSSKCFGCH
jgi:predicted CxxxxCH...CXXCH cytochrome family protein